jgi:hypothetical protein
VGKKQVQFMGVTRSFGLDGHLGGFVNKVRANSFCIPPACQRLCRMGEPCKTTSQAGQLSSKAPNSRKLPPKNVFSTITGEDWKRSIASARQRPNAALEQIRTAISSSSPKTP